MRLLIVISLAAVAATGCGEGLTEPDLNPDFMVGDWLAESMVLEAVFTLSVQPSGRYTAILEGFGLPSSESGKLTVDAAYAVLMPETPRGCRSRETCGSAWATPSS